MSVGSVYANYTVPAKRCIKPRRINAYRTVLPGAAGATSGRAAVMAIIASAIGVGPNAHGRDHGAPW